MQNKTYVLQHQNQLSNAFQRLDTLRYLTVLIHIKVSPPIHRGMLLTFGPETIVDDLSKYLETQVYICKVLLRVTTLGFDEYVIHVIQWRDKC